MTLEFQKLRHRRRLIGATAVAAAVAAGLATSGVAGASAATTPVLHDPDLHRDGPGRRPAPPGRRVGRQRHGVRVQHRRQRGRGAGQRRHHRGRRVAVGLRRARRRRPGRQRVAVPPRRHRRGRQGRRLHRRQRRQRGPRGHRGRGHPPDRGHRHRRPGRRGPVRLPGHAQLARPPPGRGRRTPHGDVFIADTYNNRVVKVTPQGQVVAVAGDGKRRLLRRRAPGRVRGAERADRRGGRRARATCTSPTRPTTSSAGSTPRPGSSPPWPATSPPTRPTTAWAASPATAAPRRARS